MLFRLWLVLSLVWAVIVGYSLSVSDHFGGPLNRGDWMIVLFPFLAGIVVRKLYLFVVNGITPRHIPAPRARVWK
jgi:hypothetical protein